MNWKPFKALALVLALLGCASAARAQSGGSAVAPTLKVTTSDGSVQANGVTELRFPAGAVQISGRTATVNPGSGSVSSTATQPANLLFASPAGSAGPGQWRRLVNADVDAAAAIAWSKVSKTMADIVAALGYTPLNPANNLSDLGSASTARTNLGLGTAATKDVAASGNASTSQVVKGDDTRLTDSRAPSGPAGGDLSGSYPNPALASVVTASTQTKITYDAKGRVTAGAQAQFSDIGGSVAAAQMPALTGDCTTSAGSVATTCTRLGGVDQTAAWTAYTPTVTPASGSFTSVSAAGRYIVTGKRVTVRVWVTITTAGTAGGYVDVSLPATARNDQYQVLSGVEVWNTGKVLNPFVILNTATVRLRFYDNSSAIANGNVLVAQGVYESQ